MSNSIFSFAGSNRRTSPRAANGKPRSTHNGVTVLLCLWAPADVLDPNSCTHVAHGRYLSPRIQASSCISQTRTIATAAGTVSSQWPSHSCLFLICGLRFAALAR
ncbi:hypothetical protein OH76DRAFT_94310 [Lentinus brumalis]|uniref:Uncharacterized protein n=1 Tax=Lentinus brumalis TaxID=2498619 RepID=A0A371CQM9_9APHY|nr:hypothetical protein OH76DRAFT_94310 [Polyporus brumalis]